jgi:HK97 family phage prohead protease
MEPKTKSFSASFKALGPDDNEPLGSFEAIVACFDNVDKVGDRLKSTSFDKTLERWRKSGDPIPVILSHNWEDPFAIIGHADPNQVKAIEGRGLYVKGMIDHLDENPLAAQVHRLMGSRLLKEFSFGYTVPAGGEKKADDGAYDLYEVNLIEIGPTLKGINPDTELLSLKSAVSAHNKRKSYVDIEIPGTFEAIRESLAGALGQKYPSPADPTKGWVSVNLVATTPSQVVYQVCEYDNGEKSDATYSASYELDEEGNATIGEPSEVQVSITPKAEAYEELVKFALKYKALEQEEAEAWAQKMVDAEFAEKSDETPEPEPVVEEKSEPEPEPVVEQEPALKSSEIDSTVNALTLEQYEHEIGKALTADALEVAALDRRLAVELSQFETDDL